MSENDWQSFVQYKKIHSVPQNSKFYLNRKFRIGFAGAASILVVSVFAFFVENHFNFFGSKYANASNKINHKDTFSDSNKNLVKNDSFVAIKQYQNITSDKINPINSEIKTIKNNDNSSFDSASSVKKHKNSVINQKALDKIVKFNIIENNNSLAIPEMVNSKSEKKTSSIESDAKKIKTESKNDIYTPVENKLSNVEISNNPNSMINNGALSKLALKKFSIHNSKRNFLSDTTIIYVIHNSKRITSKPHFIVSGTVGFVKPFKDQFDRKKLSAKNLSVNYYLLKKLRLGINYGVSSDISKIERKEKYPRLNDVKPHHPDVKLEELTMKTLHKKIGIEANYDVLTYKRFIGSLGLGFKHDISNNYNFRLKVKEKDGMQYFEEQEQKFIEKNRNYLVPKLSIEYQVLDNIRLKSLVEYEASISDLSEKYLSLEAGIAFCF
ncbi:MAG: hypothetical protein ACM3PT_00425 [Deltaproteobacteria bacterium]